MSRALPIVLAVAAAVAWTLARPFPPPDPPVALEPTGVDVARSVVRDSAGRVMIYNFRAVDEGRLYRGSAFPLVHRVAAPGGGTREVYADGSAFEFLRGLDVRHVVVLTPDLDRFYAEEGYFHYWAEQTGYVIRATWAPVEAGALHARHDRSALHAAAEVLFIARSLEADGGAVYVHDADGVHAAGIAVAGYELWRSRGTAPDAARWDAVVARYRATGETMRAYRATGGAPREASPCGGPAVCPDLLAPLRTDLAFLAGL